ncbi:alpha/beta fold hydrolase [Erwinia sp. 198]|uniref:alpha/beta fold hydrolase n=1 Tax=Erwinia sp. 198 TaxID=2022746 RepID=UPI000F6653FA|nr:alpha/beta hydrolase [Erwinia sp. 198]RRZ91693.1 alpha/beta hydrolase [Erwinia sp. 198]
MLISTHTEADRQAIAAFQTAAFWQQFRHEYVEVNGIRLHYVIGGSGDPVLLLPGWPQSWYAWRYVMPLLIAAGRRVIAVDPRGLGDSAHPADGYDMTTTANDIHQLIATLKLNESGPIDVVCHDIGSWIGYALAADWPEDVKRLALFDAALPGISPPPPSGIPTDEANVKSWHFAFNRLNDLPEILFTGRERELISWLFAAKSLKSGSITPADLEEYVRVNQLPGALRSALSYYRTGFSPASLAAARQRAEKKLLMPVLAVGAEGSVGDTLLTTLQQLAVEVKGGAVAGVGHYIPEEAPATLAGLLADFFIPSGSPTDGR